jgi:hypothetical protein
MKKSHVLISIFASSAIAQVASALPTHYPPESSRITSIQNPTNSSILADTRNANQFYVTPPKRFDAKVEQIIANANAGFCNEMSDLQLSSRLLSKRIKELALQVAAKDTEATAAKDRANALKQEASKFFISKPALGELRTLNDRIEDNQALVDEKRDLLLDCEGTACDILEKDIDELRADIKADKATVRELERTYREDIRKYDRLMEQARLAEDEVTTIGDELLTINTKVQAFQTQLFSTYSKFARLEGGTASLNYESAWTENINRLESMYPDLNFLMLPTKDVKLYATFVGAATEDSYLASLPSVLDYTIGGVGYSPFGEQKVTMLPSLPEQLTANVRLSLIGTCPVLKPDAFDIPKENTGVPKYGITATYTYPVGIFRRLKMDYNLYRVYERMSKTKTSGGLFTSKSKKEVRESSWDDETLKIDWMDQGEGAEKLSETDKTALTNTFKDELMAQVLLLQGVPLVDGKATPSEAPNPPPRGAMVVAEGLEKSCGWYSWYCTGGAWVLKGLDAIFGSSSSESNFRKEHNIKISREWSDEQSFDRPGTIGY